MKNLNIKRMKSMKNSSIKRGVFLTRSGRGSIVNEKKYSNLEILKYRRIEKELKEYKILLKI